MGHNLKLVSGSEAVQKLQRAGWTVMRQKGSHVMLTQPGYQWTLSVPQHDEIGPGLLRKPLKRAGLTVDEFNKL